MKPKLKIYLDTSVVNFLFADDAPELKKITEDFFDNYVMKGVYETYISGVVLQEINNTSDQEMRIQLLKRAYEVNPLFADESNTDEIQRLADLYVQKGIIPAKKTADALHVAITTVNRIDFLVSWNYKHLANINRERKIIAVNTAENYFNYIRIVTPIQLIDYGNESV